MAKKTVLFIDDKEKLCKSLELNFSQLGYACHYRLSGWAALRGYHNIRPDIVLLDLALGEEDGLEVLKEIKRKDPLVPVLMITGYGSIDTAVAAIKNGASDYIQKPLHFPHLLKIVESLLRRSSRESKGPEETVVTRSALMKALLEKAKRLAETDFPVLLVGESGTGKERFAHYIHQSSSRREKEMHCINCAAFPENLLDNELFGHEKGAYTGADQQFPGIFERAGGGTLFMDEIGDMSLQTQAKILRTLQNREVRRIGGEKTIRIDARFIGATNRDLGEMMQEKRFREDLYYRLSTAVIPIPPLRERREDILPLADYFLREHFRERNFRFSDEALEKMLRHDWPGNIRELRNAVHYAGALAAGDLITPGDLPGGPAPLPRPPERKGSLEEYEKTLILKALTEAENNKKRAAEILNISRKTLYNKLEKYGIGYD